MRNPITLVAGLLLAASVCASAQMTDGAIEKYVKKATAQGKTEQTIAKELLRKGATQAQLRQLKARYESSRAAAEAVISGTWAPVLRTETSVERENPDESPVGNNEPEANLQEFEYPINVATDSVTIFGFNIFNNRSLSFEPNNNMATPRDYVLGPGDEVVIDVWGYSEGTVRQRISPEGRIMISQIGPVFLSGLTIMQAEEKIRKAFSRKYSAMGGPSPKTEISVTLGNIRSIQVNVMGEVNAPGTYRISAFSTVFSALYRAGGVTKVGSMRAVSVSRAGQKVADIDVYDYIFNGNSGRDIRLEEGDIIIVPPYTRLVRVDGSVKRPMSYEMKEGETLSKLLEYAGGLTGDAYSELVNIIRYDGSERSVLSVKKADFDKVEMCGGDQVSVSKALSRFSNAVDVRGAVFRPGTFQLGGDIATVRQLVEHAGGLTEEAFLSRAQLLRENPDKSHRTLAINIGAIMSGDAEDVLLQKNDQLVVSNNHEITDPGIFTINGFVAAPGSYMFSENTSVEDLIMIAGGLLEGASTAKVEVSRRMTDTGSQVVTGKYAEVYTFALNDDLSINDANKFILEPYDVVSVRKSPGFIEQRIVSFTGQVTFPGDYALTNNAETLSDLVKRAGGLTMTACPKGAVLRRRMTQDELSMREAAMDMAARSGTRDTVKVDLLNLDNFYTVPLELEKAIAKPHSNFDIVLRDGDTIVVPENLSTVKIEGDVMCPNTVLWIKGKPLSYYIDAAGGYSPDAKRSKVYIVYMNGRVARASMAAKVEAGCQIIVPARKERKSITTSEILSMGSTAASIGTMAATIFNLIR